MTRYELAGVDLAEFLWRPVQVVSPGWAHFIVGIDRCAYAIDPTVRIRHHGYGASEVSGCTWDLLYGVEGVSREDRYANWRPGFTQRWEICLSYRGPLMTAVSWSDPKLAQDQPVSRRLAETAADLATRLGLTYLDAEALRGLEIAWEDMRGDAHRRLDWSDVPNAFNLLFYEY